MKRLISVILAGVLALSLCGCGAAAKPSVGDQMYEKYGSIIDKLEAGEYEKVIEEVTAMMPVPEEQTVTVTLDNFSDYYELRYDVPQVNRDSQGKLSSVNYSGTFYYGLKEEYAARLVPESSYVEVGVTADCAVKKVDSIDWQTGDFTVGTQSFDNIKAEIQNTYRDLPVSVSATLSGEQALYGGEATALNYGAFRQVKDTWGTMWISGPMSPADNTADYYVFAPENIKILRAEGTLTLRG